MDHLPADLSPTASEELEVSPGLVIEVAKATPSWIEWRGARLAGPFGNKPLVEVAGERLFAELAILRLLEGAGWNARWVQTYTAPKSAPHLLRAWTVDGMPGDQTAYPIDDVEADATLHRVAERNGGWGGCWDVFAWKDGELLFAEAKRKKKDAIRATQLGWLSAALSSGLDVENFLLVEWSFDDE